jgi:uncharacterized RDD family membrane protein YckC
MILRRLAALFYDSLLLLALLIIWTTLLILLNKGQSLSPSPGYRLSLILIIAFYFIGFWRHGGQTSGMKAWGLKLISTRSQHQTLTYFQALLRFILAIPSLLFLGIGFFWLLFNKKHLTLYDRLSRIKMIYLFQK